MKNNFGPYKIRASTEKDYVAIISLIKHKTRIDQEKNRASVYTRKAGLIKNSAKAGGYILLVRERLNKETLVGIVGFYLNEYTSQQNPKSIDSTSPQKYFIGEVGTAIYAKEIDTPNEYNLLPKSGFYNLLISIGCINLFFNLHTQLHIHADHMAAFLCIEKNHMGVAAITQPPHNWKPIIDPSNDVLMALQSSTTDRIAPLVENFFFYTTPSNIKASAEFVNSIMKNRKISDLENIIHLENNFSSDFLEFIDKLSK